MKKSIFILVCLAVSLSAAAQTDVKIQQSLEEAKLRLEEFNTEYKMDTLDQEKLPRLVSGGVLAGVNTSNFIITRDHHTMSSYMRVGGELGGFLDFTVVKHFAIQPQVLFTAHQNIFTAEEETKLWSFGVDIPIYFLGRFGSLDKGYIQFGGGIFTHFTFASNVDAYQNFDTNDGYDYSLLYKLHNNHFGLCLTVGYEFSFGMQINAQYKISVSDIAGFYSEKKGDPVADALIFPQSASIVLGYRWR